MWGVAFVNRPPLEPNPWTQTHQTLRNFRYLIQNVPAGRGLVPSWSIPCSGGTSCVSVELFSFALAWNIRISHPNLVQQSIQTQLLSQYHWQLCRLHTWQWGDGCFPYIRICPHNICTRVHVNWLTPVHRSSVFYHRPRGGKKGHSFHFWVLCTSKSNWTPHKLAAWIG